MDREEARSLIQRQIDYLASNIRATERRLAYEQQEVQDMYLRIEELQKELEAL